MARYNRSVTETTGVGATPSLIRWGAVFAGAVMGLSLLLLLAALWFALGFGNDVEVVTQNMAWFLTGSAILAMFVGGLLAGWLSGVPGAGPGTFNGLTVWGLILIAGLAIGPAAFMRTMGIPTAGEAEQALGELTMQGDALWATFLSLIIGALAAGLGGTIGGAITHPAFVYAAPVMEKRQEERQEEHRETERTENWPTTRQRTKVEGATVDIREDPERVGTRGDDTEHRRR